MSLDTKYDVITNLADFIRLKGGIFLIDKLYKIFDPVTPVDTIEIAKKYFVRKKRIEILLKGKAK